MRLITRCFEAQYLNQPFLSLSYEGCIENGVDAVAWDEIPNPWINVAGGIDAADSLAALKKLVFEEKRYTMAQVLEAIRNNWEGYENMRQEFINDAPKFGNDDDYVDEVARGSPLLEMPVYLLQLVLPVGMVFFLVEAALDAVVSARTALVVPREENRANEKLSGLAGVPLAGCEEGGGLDG